LSADPHSYFFEGPNQRENRSLLTFELLPFAMFLDLRIAEVPHKHPPHFCRDDLEVVSNFHTLLEDVIKLAGLFLAD
jgi:hypothetical protein